MKRTSDIFDLIKKEEQRQRETIDLIASENYTYPEIRKTGLNPKKWGVNVQPYSGSPANLAVLNALLNPGDKIMAMYLFDGGHVSHGWDYQERKITLASKIYKTQFYRVDKKTLVFDYEKIQKQAKKFKPKLIISGGTAYPREIDYKKMGEIAKSAGAFYLADVAHEAGLIAGGIFSSPFSHADVVTMTTHKTLRGPRGAVIFAKNNLIDRINSSVFPGIQGGPHLETIAAIAMTFRLAQDNSFSKYGKQVIKNAQKLTQVLKSKGYEILADGTDKHLLLIDLRRNNITGWHAAIALEKAGIVVNRSTIPHESGSPYYPSGIRLGTPAITTRGMKEREMEMIACLIDEVIKHVGERLINPNPEKRNRELKKFKTEMSNDKYLQNTAKKVKKLLERFPMP